jgi:hypothetical protein
MLCRSINRWTYIHIYIYIYLYYIRKALEGQPPLGVALRVMPRHGPAADRPVGAAHPSKNLICDRRFPHGPPPLQMPKPAKNSTTQQQKQNVRCGTCKTNTNLKLQNSLAINLGFKVFPTSSFVFQNCIQTKTNKQKLCVHRTPGSWGIFQK